MTSLGRQTAKHWNHDLQCGLLEVNTDEEAKLVTLILPPLNGASGEGGRRAIKVLRVPVSKAPKETKEFREVKEIKAGKAHKDFRALSVPKVTWALRATKEQAFRGPKGHEAASSSGLTLGLAATQESATSCTTIPP